MEMPMMKPSEFRLIDSYTRKVTVVPLGLTRLNWSADAAWVCDIEDCADGEMRLEVLQVGRRTPSLAVSVRKGAPQLVVSGLVRPRLSLLTDSDFVRVGENCFWVTRYISPVLRCGEQLPKGSKCPVCRTPHGGDATALICECGAAFHLGGELGCAEAITECTACRRPMVREACYTFIPEGFNPVQEGKQ